MQLKVAVNAWFADSTNTGSGQYLMQLTAAMREVAPDIAFEFVTPASRGDLTKVWFEQNTFPRAVARMHAQVAFVPYWAPPLRSQVPVVCTVHDVIPLALPQYRGKLKHRLYSSLARAGTSGTTAILTDSEHSKLDILRLLAIPAGKVTVVPLAPDPTLSPNVSTSDADRVRARYNLPEGYVLYLGGFDPRKNIETLLQVFTWCGETIGHEYILVINGTAETKITTTAGASTTLGQLIQDLDVVDVVRPIGRVADEDKSAVLALARCFLFASTYEGFGLPPLEAMACGVPVVGSNASSLPEVVGSAGMLIEPLNARRMAGSVIAVCTDDDLHDRLAQRALLRAAQFTWQRTALETAVVLRAAAFPT